MTLLEATRWIKDKYNLEMAPNTLRKACASFRLKATRIGESNTHIRRTQWDVSVDDLINFLQKEYHPRPKSKGRKSSVKQLPKKRNIFDLVDLSLNTKGKFRVVEHIFQAPLSLYGVDLEKYDTRILLSKIATREEAERIVRDLEEQALHNNLADQLRYEIEHYFPKETNGI